ncbi:hypothetical protein ACFLEY_22355 [Bradyrhizobium sp. YCK136]|uniref:hypothetical protein n=1 Tax=Bradyrhizobium sp. YCK136 TaxID=3351346 RepID=UPI0037C9FB2E
MDLMPHTDPVIIESRVRALKAADHYLRQGLPTFTFEDEAGRAYVTTDRRDAAFALDCGAKFVGYCTPRMYEVAAGVWAEPGRA